MLYLGAPSVPPKSWREAAKKRTSVWQEELFKPERHHIQYLRAFWSLLWSAAAKGRRGVAAPGGGGGVRRVEAGCCFRGIS